MKRIFLVVFLLLYYSNFSHCQSRDLPIIEIKDIEMGFTDIDYLRSILIEKGFSIGQKEGHDSTDINKGAYYPETWNFLDPVKQKKSELGEIHLLFFYVNMTQKELQVNALKKEIHIKIDRNLIPEYVNTFLNNVKKSFPEKKIEHTYIFKNNEWQESGYKLVYFRKSSSIKVELEVVDQYSWFSFFLL